MSTPRRPPRGKVRTKTPIRPNQPIKPAAKSNRPGRPARLPVWVFPLLAVAGAIALGIGLGIRSSEPDDPVAALPTETLATTTAPTAPTATTPRPARVAFEETCATCHVLAAAGATGGIGPNLDELKPNRTRVLATIRNGTLSGVMPAGLLEGAEAERVAAYVAANAGR